MQILSSFAASAKYSWCCAQRFLKLTINTKVKIIPRIIKYNSRVHLQYIDKYRIQSWYVRMTHQKIKKKFQLKISPFKSEI